MIYHGVRNWPPVWVNTRAVPVKKISGEVGTIQTAFFPETPKRPFLIMEIENECYMGCLVFSEAGFCQQLRGILQTNACRSIKDIGDLDLSCML
jgi:hypothetical protein